MPPFIDARTLHIDLQGFYGNRVKKFMHVKCDCGKKYIAFMEVSRNTYTIIDLAEDNLEEEVIPFADNNIAQKQLLDKLSRKDLVILAVKNGFDGNAVNTKSLVLKDFLMGKE